MQHLIWENRSPNMLKNKMTQGEQARPLEHQLMVLHKAGEDYYNWLSGVSKETY